MDAGTHTWGHPASCCAKNLSVAELDAARGKVLVRAIAGDRAALELGVVEVRHQFQVFAQVPGQAETGRGRFRSRGGRRGVGAEGGIIDVGIAVARRQFEGAQAAIAEVAGRLDAALVADRLAGDDPRGRDGQGVVFQAGGVQRILADVLFLGNVVGQQAEIVDVEPGLRVRTGQLAVRIDTRGIAEEGLLAGGLLAANLGIGGLDEVLAIRTGVADAEALQEDDAGIEERLGEDAVDNILLVIEVVVQVDAICGSIEQTDLVFQGAVEQISEDLITNITVGHEPG